MIPRKQVMATTRNTFPGTGYHLKEDRIGNLCQAEDEHTGRLSNYNNNTQIVKEQRVSNSGQKKKTKIIQNDEAISTLQ